MNYKIMFLVALAYSGLIFSAADTQQKSQEYWKARSQTASEQKVDEVLGKWVPGYGWVPGVASLIGEPAKEIALLGQGIWGISHDDPEGTHQFANFLARETVGVISTFLVKNALALAAPNAHMKPNIINAFVRPSTIIMRSIKILMVTSLLFNEAYTVSLNTGETTMNSILNGIKVASMFLGVGVFFNWVSGQFREFWNRIQSGALQKSYYIQGNDAYNQKIDIIFEQNPMLFTLAKDTDRKLLIAAKLAEMENPHIFDALKIEEQTAQAQVVENQAVGLEQDKKSLPTAKMATPKIANKRVTRRK